MERVKFYMAHFVAALGWLSVFAQVWLTLFDLIDSPQKIFSFIFFLLVALIATLAVAASDRRIAREKGE
jgi:membrane protein DedA with SNARE-associated domain